MKKITVLTLAILLMITLLGFTIFAEGGETQDVIDTLENDYTEDEVIEFFGGADNILDSLDCAENYYELFPYSDDGVWSPRAFFRMNVKLKKSELDHTENIGSSEYKYTWRVYVYVGGNFSDYSGGFVGPFNLPVETYEETDDNYIIYHLQPKESVEGDFTQFFKNWHTYGIYVGVFDGDVCLGFAAFPTKWTAQIAAESSVYDAFWKNHDRSLGYTTGIHTENEQDVKEAASFGFDKDWNFTEPELDDTILDTSEEITISGPIYGLNNYSGNTRLIIYVKERMACNYKDTLWELTITSSKGETTVVRQKPSNWERAFISGEYIWSFDVCEADEKNMFIPESGETYSIDVKVWSNKILTYYGYAKDKVWIVSGDFVPILPEGNVPAEKIKNGIYSQGGNLYYYLDGEKAKGWFEHNGMTYYASSVTNVVINYDKVIGGKQYFWNDETGLVLADGFIKDDIGTKCYENGYPVIGWRHTDGSGPKVENGISEQYSTNPDNLYYFLSTTGYMVTDETYTLGGYLREFNADHTVKPLNGLQNRYGELYYYVDGVIQTGWQTIDGVTYYFRASDNVYGRAATKWMYIGNKVYYFYASTSATPYALKTEGKIGGIEYTYHEDGYIIYDGFVNVDFANEANNNTAPNIQKMNGTTRYYVDGEMQTGWQNIDGTWYYFYKVGSANGSGYMCCESRTIGGVWYEFTEDGICKNYNKQINSVAFVIYNNHQSYCTIQV